MLQKMKDANTKLMEERDALHVRYQGQFEDCKKAMLKVWNISHHHPLTLAQGITWEQPINTHLRYML